MLIHIINISFTTLLPLLSALHFQDDKQSFLPLTSPVKLNLEYCTHNHTSHNCQIGGILGFSSFSQISIIRHFEFILKQIQEIIFFLLSRRLWWGYIEDSINFIIRNFLEMFSAPTYPHIRTQNWNLHISISSSHSIIWQNQKYWGFGVRSALLKFRDNHYF